jgi:hypothetical protein
MDGLLRIPRKDVVYVDSLDDSDDEEGADTSLDNNKTFDVLDPELRRRLQILGRGDDGDKIVHPRLPLYRTLTPPQSEGIAERGLVLYRPLFKPPTAEKYKEKDGSDEMGTSREGNDAYVPGSDSMDIDE